MTITTLTEVRPIMGVPDGASSSDPAVRQAWLDQRRGGITATDIRDWGNGSDRRKIMDEKVLGTDEDIDAIRVRGSEFTLGDYARHGKRREPVIAAWMQGRFGITPCDNVYSRGDNLRHLASPDGITLDIFTKELVVGPDAELAEIKTGKWDLLPGTLDADRVLIDITVGSQFDKKNYYTQMQWQMFVMNAARTLFVWEQHDNKVDPETQTFTPLGPPQWAWIPRNDAVIAQLVKMADKALAEIDAARLALKSGELPPASAFPAEHAVWAQEVLDARDVIATAEASRDKGWTALQENYLGDDKPDVKHDLGFATLTVSTSTSPAKSVEQTSTDWDAVRAGLTDAQRKKYDALVAKHTKTENVLVPGKTTRRMTLTAKKGNH